jgi:molecular chaperone DnaK
MISDAETHAEEDQAQRQLAEARNVGENAAHEAEKQLGELGDKVDEAQKTEIEAAIKEVRDSLASDDAKEIGEKTEKLQTAFQAVSAKVYEQASAESSDSGPSNSSNGSDASSEEEVVDAEVVDDEPAQKE